MSMVMEWIFDTQWAITENGLSNIIKIANRESIATKTGTQLEKTKNMQVRENGIAVLDITGPIFPRANLFTEISGATSISQLAKDFQIAIDDYKVKGIVLNIDSPGGAITGISEFAQLVKNASKPVTAYVYGYGASAAYWIASAANKIYLADTAEVGSIGVVGTFRTGKNVDSIEIVSSVSPNKRVDVTTESGRSEVQKTIDDLASVFVATVAKNRNVSIEKVASDFGKGGTLVGQKSVEVGMSDGVSTLEKVISYMGKNSLTHKGGFSMDIEKLKAEHADIYQAAFSEGVASVNVEQIKIDAANAERERIQSIESIIVPGAEKIISSAKFDGTKTKADVSVMICDAFASGEIKPISVIAPNAIAIDAANLATVSASVATGEGSNATGDNEFIAAAKRQNKKGAK